MVEQTWEQDVPVTKLTDDQRRLRILSDILRFSAASIDQSYRRLYNTIAERMWSAEPGEAAPFSEDDSTSLMADAWNIVDRCYTLTGLIRRHGNHVSHMPGLTVVLEHSREAFALRNGMDHLDGNVATHVSMRKAHLPLLGFLTAAFIDRRKIVNGKLDDLMVCAVSGSDFHHRLRWTYDIESLFPMRSEVDHICLHAFGGKLDLSNVYSAIQCAMPNNVASPPDNRVNVMMALRGAKPFVVEQAFGVDGPPVLQDHN